MRVLLKTILMSPYVLLVVGVVLALFVLPGGSWLLTDGQRQGTERTKQAESRLSEFDQRSIAFELGAAHAYAEGCEMVSNIDTLAAVLYRFSLDPADMQEGGAQRKAWMTGASRVISLLEADGGWSGNRSLTCSLAAAAYGAGGSRIPYLLGGSR